MLFSHKTIVFVWVTATIFNSWQRRQGIGQVTKGDILNLINHDKKMRLAQSLFVQETGDVTQFSVWFYKSQKWLWQNWRNKLVWFAEKCNCFRHLPAPTNYILPHLFTDMLRGAPKGRARGSGPPLGTWKHYIFRVSSVKLRDLHLWSLFFMLFAMWEDWGSLQHGK